MHWSVLRFWVWVNRGKKTGFCRMIGTRSVITFACVYNGEGYSNWLVSATIYSTIKSNGS
jgi:hypothetical protein